MSYNTWHEYGYGICADQIGVISVERLQALIQMAPAFENKISAWLEENETTKPTTDDYFEFNQDAQGGIAIILKSVIKEVEGLELLYCNDFDGRNYLIFAPVYPWSMAESEKDMTEERLEGIYRKYVSILTETQITVDYQSVGNGG